MPVVLRLGRLAHEDGAALFITLPATYLPNLISVSSSAQRTAMAQLAHKEQIKNVSG
jgi:hypothetical protein